MAAKLLIIVLVSALVLASNAARPCDDLADALVDLQDVAASLSDELSQQVQQARFGLQMQLGVDASDRDQLKNFVCQFHGVTNVNEFADILGVPAEYLRPSLAGARAQWQLIGGAAGLRRLSEPILRAADAFERIGIFNLV